MTDTITVTGLVGTDPRHLTTGEGLPIMSFRLASTQRRYDRSTQSWVDGDTNWYTVTAFRRLAANAAGSISKGQRVLVTGRLRLREWESGDRRGTNVEIEADALGHDLSWGTSSFTRNAVAVSLPDAAASAAPDAAAEAFPSAASLAGGGTGADPGDDGSAGDTPPAAEEGESSGSLLELAEAPF